MFGIGNGRLVREVASGTFNLVSLLDAAGIGQPARFWRDPYVLGYLFGTASMLLAIASKFKNHGTNVGQLLDKAFLEFAGPRGDQVVSDLSQYLRSQNAEFLDAARISSQIVAYIYGLAQDDLDQRLYAAIAKGSERASSTGRDVSIKMIKQHVYDVFVEANWLNVIRQRFQEPNEEFVSEADLALIQAISMSKMLCAKTPREAAEMTMGRPLSDAEWEKWKAPWEHYWSLVPEPSVPVFDDSDDE